MVGIAESLKKSVYERLTILTRVSDLHIIFTVDDFGSINLSCTYLPSASQLTLPGFVQGA